MQTQSFCSRYYKKLYRFCTSFFQGFLHLIGAEENPYDKDVRRIFNRTDNEALSEDFEKINNDFISAFKKYEKQFPYE